MEDNQITQEKKKQYEAYVEQVTPKMCIRDSFMGD